MSPIKSSKNFSLSFGSDSKKTNSLTVSPSRFAKYNAGSIKGISPIKQRISTFEENEKVVEVEEYDDSYSGGSVKKNFKKKQSKSLPVGGSKKKHIRINIKDLQKR